MTVWKLEVGKKEVGPIIWGLICCDQTELTLARPNVESLNVQFQMLNANELVDFLVLL